MSKLLKNNKTKIIVKLLLLCFSVAAALTIVNYASSAPREYTFVGDASFAPYSFFPKKNIEGFNTQNELINVTIIGDKPNGYAVDATNALSEVINKKINIKLLPWEKCITEIVSSRADGIIGMLATDAHKKYLEYSYPIAEIEFAIFVEAGNNYVNSLESLEGTIVGVYKKSPVIDFLKEKQKIKLHKTNSVAEAINLLEKREVSAVIAEKYSAQYYIQQTKLIDLKIVGSAVGPVYKYSMAIRKDRLRLLALINRGLNILEENETLKKLKRKWFGWRLTATFPWRLVLITTGSMTAIIILVLTLLWVISLRATLAAKTRQIQLMSQKMVQKDKLAVLGKLAGQIAHELRTPLSIINNSVYLLRKEGSADRDLFEKRLRVLQEKIKLTSNILESILSYSRVKAEIASIISVKTCLEEVMKDIELPDEIEEEVTFENKSLLTVFMDFHQLYSVLRNLVLNSVQAMGGAGKISLKVYLSKNRSSVIIEIQDTGPGIEESAQNKIFHLFYSSKITGTGLGLPISKSIIEANSGKLYLKDTSEQGSCFIVELPAVKKTKRS